MLLTDVERLQQKEDSGGTTRSLVLGTLTFGWQISIQVEKYITQAVRDMGLDDTREFWRLQTELSVISIEVILIAVRPMRSPRDTM